ncbi:phage tail fiber protein [Prescottella equi]|uniref:phage tail fiber protein n=1 Tax=Rhodococcus hoagii TaxID=43767 RepID=UPI000D0E4A34|nr:hypothetical protein [Prescottella equi]AVP71343.1 hypothetical protein C7H75_24995 [Prescottella equi]
MAIAVATTRQALADAYKALGAHISVHTADPGTTGANEAAGGSPGYARKPTTWTSGTGGVLNGSQVVIDLPAGTYAWAGLWSAASGGTFLDKVAISSTTLGGQGQLLITPTYVQT